MQQLIKRIETVDRAAARTMADIAMPLLRVSLGVVYLWFGALKIAGKSPIENMVAETVPFIPKRWLIRGLGLWEMVIGGALLLRLALRPTLVLFFLQVIGTFMTFLTQPRRMFQHGNPLLLSKDGEFVLKNLILLAAGLAVGSTMRRENEDLPAEE